MTTRIGPSTCVAALVCERRRRWWRRLLRVRASGGVEEAVPLEDEPDPETGLLGFGDVEGGDQDRPVDLRVGDRNEVGPRGAVGRGRALVDDRLQVLGVGVGGVLVV